mgnify:CR=1 FL=1
MYVILSLMYYPLIIHQYSFPSLHVCWTKGVWRGMSYTFLSEALHFQQGHGEFMIYLSMEPCKFASILSATASYDIHLHAKYLHHYLLLSPHIESLPLSSSIYWLHLCLKDGLEPRWTSSEMLLISETDLAENKERLKSVSHLGTTDLAFCSKHHSNDPLDMYDDISPSYINMNTIIHTMVSIWVQSHHEKHDYHHSYHSLKQEYSDPIMPNYVPSIAMIQLKRVPFYFFTIFIF